MSLEETEYLYFETQFSLLRNTEGKVYAVLASTIDVTNRELPRMKQQELIDTISSAMKASKTTAWSLDITKKKYRIFNNDTHEYCDYIDTVDLVHPEDKLKYKQFIQDIINGQKTSSCNIFRLLDNTTNTYRYKEYSAKILCNKSGEPVELVGITTDITDILNEKEETEKMKIQYETMFNSLKAGVEIRDKRGTLLRFNKAYAQILGIEKPEELYSSTRNIDQIYEIDTMARKALKEMCEYHGTVDYDFDYIREKEIYTTSRTGKIYLFANIAPLTDNKGNILGTVSLIEDITASKNQQRIIDEERMKKDLALKGSKTTLWTFDSAQKIFVLSGFYQEITNQDLTLESVISCVHPDDLPLFKAKMEDMCSSKNCSFCIDLRYHTLDDHEWIYATMSSAPFKFDENGKCISYIGYLKDNTREVKLNYALKQSAKRIDYIFEQSDIDSWDYIPENEILIIYPNNKSENKITIIPDADHIRTFVKEDQETIKKVFNQMNNLETQGFSITVKRKINGKYQYINLNGTPIKDINGNVIKYSGLRRNITDIMEVQERLKNEKEKALQADKLKSAFLANMSHEIRTPLNAIVGFSQLLDSVTEEEERKQYIDIISTNSDILLKLIHDILDLSKIEAGITEYVMSDFDLYSVMDEIGTFVSQKTINTEVELIKEYPTEKFIIHSDRNKVAQMLINLATNSVKYTHRGTISIGYKKGSGRNVILFVKDTGIGIPKDKRHRIFQRFDKLDSFVQGTGLGLVITKSIAEGLGGKIEFDSTEGEGTTFRITLPTVKE